MERIPINIWDDFCEDGFLEEGEIQTTYAYVETSKISDENKEVILTCFLRHIQKELLIEGVNAWVEFKQYNPEHDFGFSRHEIIFEHITHTQIETLLEKIKEHQLFFKGVPLHIYSES